MTTFFECYGPEYDPLAEAWISKLKSYTLKLQPTIDPRVLYPGVDESLDSYCEPLPSVGPEGTSVPYVTAFDSLEDSVFAPVSFDAYLSFSDYNTSTPELTPDMGLMDLSSEGEDEGGDEDAEDGDCDGEESSPVPLSCIDQCDNSTLSSETPLSSISDLSSSSSASVRLLDGCEEDADGESEDGSDSDSDSEYTLSEFASSSRLLPLKERPAYTRIRALRDRTSSASASSSSSTSSRRVKRSARSQLKDHSLSKAASASPRQVKSRCVQVPADFVCPEAVNFHCPVPGCTHVQRNHRKLDLDRHIDAHYARARKYWICCGLPVSQATHAYEASDAKFWPETGQIMVGGCGISLARKDALKRHLNISGECYGDANGDWIPGNKRKY